MSAPKLSYTQRKALQYADADGALCEPELYLECDAGGLTIYNVRRAGGCEMSAVTSEDLWIAAFACNDAVRDELRTLNLLGDYCTSDMQARIEARIAEHRAREERFKKAARDAFLAERDHD